MNKIDELICEIRGSISDEFEEFDSTTEDLIRFLKVADEKSYHSIIDSFYLLEDTQLAKHEFCQIDYNKESNGKLYLFFYGVLNSCYMQQQAILVICEKLGISENIIEIKAIEVVAYRNDFSAHSSNRGRGKSEHSFIFNRLAMSQGKVMGYSDNHESGTVFREAEISILISDWDRLLGKQLELISSRISGKQHNRIAGGI
ncbi:hypothetical protein [Shewanella sp. SR44-3]|uniref:hypothetical protein n=1 Tax=unclassified Shewanella TaxID=196818 RepID=UPI0015FC3523|nr:hypothetical protein [Shewanella sp. SR44-3]MBB1270165.1 hypothetical protein [Shewanella sp. SR44-3]